VAYLFRNPSRRRKNINASAVELAFLVDYEVKETVGRPHCGLFHLTGAHPRPPRVANVVVAYSSYPVSRGDSRNTSGADCCEFGGEEGEAGLEGRPGTVVVVEAKELDWTCHKLRRHWANDLGSCFGEALLHVEPLDEGGLEDGGENKGGRDDQAVAETPESVGNVGDGSGSRNCRAEHLRVH